MYLIPPRVGNTHKASVEQSRTAWKRVEESGTAQNRAEQRTHAFNDNERIHHVLDKIVIKRVRRVAVVRLARGVGVLGVNVFLCKMSAVQTRA